MRTIQVSSTLSRAFAAAVSLAILTSYAQDTTPGVAAPTMLFYTPASSTFWAQRLV